MKKKIRVLVSDLILETLEQDHRQFGLSKEGLCNEILLKFSLKLRLNYQQDMLYEKKEYLQFNLNKANQRYYHNLISETQELNESEIVREIFSVYAVLHPFLREVYIFREKITFIGNAVKECRVVKIDTPDGVLDGRIEKIERCKEKGYLKIVILGKSYYISQMRVIS
ncbi:MAG: hypothetical protein ACRCZ9_10370 [Fusobacteriaceae bacterium]